MYLYGKKKKTLHQDPAFIWLVFLPCMAMLVLWHWRFITLLYFTLLLFYFTVLS